VKFGIEHARMGGVGLHRKEEPWHLGPQVHRKHEMIVLRTGRQDLVVAGRRYAVAVGDAVIYPAGKPHEEWGAQDEPLETIHFGFTWEQMPRNFPVVFNDRRGRLRALAAWLLEEREQPSPLSDDTYQLLLRNILIECVRLWQCPDEGFVSRIREFVSRNLERKISLAMLAREADMSRCHLVRRYREVTGQTPMAEVRMRRLQRARDLIMSTKLPLKAIPPMVGLSDVYQMGRLFRRYWNITPGSLRRGVN
jgi:AraC-like DNA-binding protein